MAEKRGEQDRQMTNVQFEALKAGTTLLGQDALNNSYWYFGGHKLYVETPSGEDSQANLIEGEEDSSWDVSCQTLKQWEGLLRKLKRSSIDEEKKLAAVVQEQVFPKAKAILETMASAQVEEEVDTLPKRRSTKKKPKPKLPKTEGGEEERKVPSRKPKKEKSTQRRKSDGEEESGSPDEELTSPLDIGEKAGVKRKPPEKEKNNGRGGGASAKKNKPSISSDDSEAIKPTKADNDEETFEIEDRPLEIAENPRTEGTRSSGRRAARNCMMRQRQVLRLTEDPSSEEEEMGRSRKRSRRDSDDDFSDEQGRKKKKSGAKRRPSTDKPPVTAYPVKLPLRPQTEERKVFMFSTNLANAAADAVEKHLVTSIIVYHCQHPSPTGYLCSSMPNVPQYSRRPGVMEGHPGQFIADPRMSGYSRPSMAPPPWDMTQMFAKQQAAVHSAVSTWQPPPFGVTDHTNNTSTQRLHNPSSQITYHPIHHPPNPFSQNPPGYPPAGGYRPLSHPPSHPMYAAFQGHIPTGVPSTQQQQQPGGPAAQLSFPDYSVEDLTQILVGGAASGAVTARPRPTTYGPSELYRAQGYEQGQVVGQPEQGTSPYGMQSGQYAYQSPPTGYPPRGQDVSGHMGREYFSSHPGMPRSHDMAMYQGVVREVASTDYHQPWGMHPRPATQPQQIQQEPQQRQTEMYNDHLRQQHPAYLRMSSPSMHTSNWPPPPPYATPQQPHERDTSGTPHDPMYQGRPQSSSNPPPRGTPTTPNTPHDVHHMWQPSGGGGSAPSDPLSHQMPTQQIDQHQETGRASGQASARSSVSGYSQADATGASTLLEMSSGVVKPGASQHPQSMAAFGSYPPGVDRSAGHMMTGPDSKYLHLVASSQPGLPLNSDPLSVLASLTDKQSPLPQTGLMHSDKGDDRHDMKGSSEGESNGSVGSSKRATCFSIENLTAPHRKDVPGMDPALNTTFTMSMAPSNMLAAGSPFPGINSIPHQGYPSQLPGWGAGNPGFQHPSQKAFHLLGSPYGAISETNHRTSEGGPQQASLADSQGDTSQQDS